MKLKAQKTKQHNAENPKPEIINRILWTTADILEATGGELICGDIDYGFSGISIDSRSVLANELFVAIKGEIHDGHSFAEDVVRQGVSGLIIDKEKVKDLPVHEWKKNKLICLAVNNTTKALGYLASFHRKRINVPVVAITGSNGKTTTSRIKRKDHYQRDDCCHC
ncbi:MAG: hypothetical protein JRJ76_09425 [Deltaproteobacteria bacterium]|nr:hypothetical protein [Deltaproteobacteria bacterium]